MAWFKVDDGFYTSLKFLSITRPQQAQAAGLWLLAGTWSADKMTDGFVPYPVLQMWVHDDEALQQLLNVGLWIDDVDRGGIQFHDWCDYQPTRESLEAKATVRSEKNKQNVAKRWDKDKSDTTGIRTVYETNTNGIRNDTPEPEPEPEPPTSNEVVKPYVYLFNNFWEIYPRKASKAEAVKSFIKAMKSNDAELIIAGATRYANDPNRVDAYTKLPATWLNQECWNDTPLPSRTVGNNKQALQDVARAEFLAATNQPQHEITTEPDWA